VVYKGSIVLIAIKLFSIKKGTTLQIWHTKGYRDSYDRICIIYMLGCTRFVCLDAYDLYAVLCGDLYANFVTVLYIVYIERMSHGGITYVAIRPFPGPQ
jgi:hypothetical protein